MRKYVRITTTILSPEAGTRSETQILEVGSDRHGYRSVTVELFEQTDDGPPREIASLKIEE